MWSGLTCVYKETRSVRRMYYVRGEMVGDQYATVAATSDTTPPSGVLIAEQTTAIDYSYRSTCVIQMLTLLHYNFDIEEMCRI